MVIKFGSNIGFRISIVRLQALFRKFIYTPYDKVSLIIFLQEFFY